MANPTSQSTGLIAPTAGTLLYIGKNIVNGAIASPGTTVSIYDNALGDASGTLVLRVINPGTTTLDHILNIGSRVDNGISVVVTAGAGAICYFGGN